MLDAPVAPNLHPELKRQLVKLIKMDLRFRQFYLSPDIKSKSTSLSEISVRLGYTEAEGREFKQDLLKTGLWIQGADGKLRVRDGFLDLGEFSTQEHMVSAMNVLAQLSDDGPCWFESLSIATNLELKKDFYRKINSAFKELVEKSAQANCDRIISWSHEVVDTHDLMDKLTETPDDD